MNYENEKKEFIAELTAGKHDIDIFPNEEADYQHNINDDFEAFCEHLKSNSSKILSAEVLKK